MTRAPVVLRAEITKTVAERLRREGWTVAEPR